MKKAQDTVKKAQDTVKMAQDTVKKAQSYCEDGIAQGWKSFPLLPVSLIIMLHACKGTIAVSQE